MSCRTTAPWTRAKDYSPRWSSVGTWMTRIELSALPLTSIEPDGLNFNDVTGKSCAWSTVRIGWNSIAPSVARIHRQHGAASCCRLTRKVTASRIPTLRSEDPYASSVPSSLFEAEPCRQWSRMHSIMKERGRGDAPDIKGCDGLLADRPRLEKLPRPGVPQADESLLGARGRFTDAPGRSCIHNGVEVRCGRPTTESVRVMARELFRPGWHMWGRGPREGTHLAARKVQASSRFRTGRSMTCSGSGTVDESATLVGQMHSLSEEVPATWERQNRR